MDYSFKKVHENDHYKVVIFLNELNDKKISLEILKARFNEMMDQNHYECVGIYTEETLIGIAGLWYCTKHYSGKTAELDHIYIEENHRNKGLGNEFIDWIIGYIKSKGCVTAELNTYVQNYPSHKFYYNKGFKILGYHFLKKL